MLFADMSSALPSASTRDFALRRTVAPYATLAPLYDALLGDRFFSRLRRAFEWLVRRYGIRFVSAADVACGTGTFVRYLRECGVPVVYGVDCSLEMLRLAIAKNRGNGARFLLQDFAALQLPEPVDLIASNFDSLNYLIASKDLLHALRRFHANLKPGGHVIFDTITNHPPWQGQQPHVERATGPGVTFTRVTRWDPRHCVQTALISIARKGRLHQEIHRQRGHPVSVVVGLLPQARFALLGVRDFQALSPTTTQTRRAIYIARKV